MSSLGYRDVLIAAMDGPDQENEAALTYLFQEADGREFAMFPIPEPGHAVRLDEDLRARSVPFVVLGSTVMPFRCVFGTPSNNVVELAVGLGLDFVMLGEPDGNVSLVHVPFHVEAVGLFDPTRIADAWSEVLGEHVRFSLPPATWPAAVTRVHFDADDVDEDERSRVRGLLRELREHGYRSTKEDA